MSSYSPFVQQVKELYRLLGHRVEGAFESGEGVTDLQIQSANGDQWLVRCYAAGPLMAEAVKEFSYLAEMRHAKDAAIVAQGDVTPQARERVGGLRLHVIDRIQLDNLLAQARALPRQDAPAASQAAHAAKLPPPSSYVVANRIASAAVPNRAVPQPLPVRGSPRKAKRGIIRFPSRTRLAVIGVVGIAILVALGPKGMTQTPQAPIPTSVPVTATPDAPTISTSLDFDTHGIESYTLGDDLLVARGRPQRIVQVGKDFEGTIFDYVYPDYIYDIRYWDGAYRVWAIHKQ